MTEINGLTLAQIRHEAEREGDEFEGYSYRDVALIVLGLLDIVQSIPPARFLPFHTLVVGDTQWHLDHPIDCRLVHCPFTGQARQAVEDGLRPGYWRMDLPGGPQVPCSCDIHSGGWAGTEYQDADWSWDPECLVHPTNPLDQ